MRITSGTAVAHPADVSMPMPFFPVVFPTMRPKSPQPCGEKGFADVPIPTLPLDLWKLIKSRLLELCMAKSLFASMAMPHQEPAQFLSKVKYDRVSEEFRGLPTNFADEPSLSVLSTAEKAFPNVADHGRMVNADRFVSRACSAETILFHSVADSWVTPAVAVAG